MAHITVGWHFSECRKQAGLTQRQLAHLAGYKSACTISRIENNKCDIPEDKLELFAKILKVSVPDLQCSSEIIVEYPSKGL